MACRIQDSECLPAGEQLNRQTDTDLPPLYCNKCGGRVSVSPDITAENGDSSKHDLGNGDIGGPLSAFKVLECQLSKYLGKFEQTLTKKLGKGLAGLEAKYLSIKRAARRVGVSDDLIRRAVQAGRLPASNLGSGGRPLYRISTSDLDEWMEKNKGGKLLPPRSALDELKARYLPGVGG